MRLHTLRRRRILAYGSFASVGYSFAAWSDVPVVRDHVFEGRKFSCKCVSPSFIRC